MTTPPAIVRPIHFLMAAAMSMLHVGSPTAAVAAPTRPTAQFVPPPRRARRKSALRIPDKQGRRLAKRTIW